MRMPVFAIDVDENRVVARAFVEMDVAEPEPYDAGAESVREATIPADLNRVGAEHAARTGHETVIAVGVRWCVKPGEPRPA